MEAVNKREAFRNVTLEWRGFRPNGISVLGSDDEESAFLQLPKIRELIARDWLTGTDLVHVYEIESDERDSDGAGPVYYGASELEFLQEVIARIERECI